MLGSDRLAWNRRSSRFEAVLPRISEKERRGQNGISKTSLQLSGRALSRVARVVLVATIALLLLLALLRRSSNKSSSISDPIGSSSAVSYFKKHWSSSPSSGQQPADWAIKAAEAILPDVRASTAAWERERLIDLAKILECRANNDCTEKQKHVVISGVGRWKWSLDETFERPAFFPNGEAGKRDISRKNSSNAD